MSTDTAPITPLTTDVGDIDASTATARTPTHLLQDRAPGFQVVLREDVMADVYGHGASTTDVEVCGVLVGDLARDDAGPYLHVFGNVRGHAASTHAAQVTFTAETWAHIHGELDRRFPGAQIVGWYHTHPGFGIFLSGMDLFIQQSFFGQPWQIALVHDPLGHDDGVFVWRGGVATREPFIVQGAEAVNPAGELGRVATPEPTSADVLRIADETAPPPDDTIKLLLLAAACFTIAYVVTSFGPSVFNWIGHLGATS